MIICRSIANENNILGMDGVEVTLTFIIIILSYYNI